MFLVILLYMLFTSTFTFGKATLTYMQPIMFIGMRMTAAGRRNKPLGDVMNLTTHKAEKFEAYLKTSSGRSFAKKRL